MGTHVSWKQRALAALAVPIALVLALVGIGAAPACACAQEEGAIELLAYRGFPDVNPDDWYVTSGSLDYAVDHDLFHGYDNGYFGPWDNVTRAQVAAVLHNIAGNPQTSSEPFADVDYSLWYGDAISWARSTGVVSGFGDTNTFKPDEPVTREQLAVMLANYAERIAKLDVSSDGRALEQIDGASQVSDWAYSAMSWAVDNKILSGVVDSGGVAHVNPRDTAQRCQAAKMVSVLHADLLGLGDVQEDEIPDDFDDSNPSSGTYAAGVVVANGLTPVYASKDGDTIRIGVKGDASALRVGDSVGFKRSEPLPLGTIIKTTDIRLADPDEIEDADYIITGDLLAIANAYDDLWINETLTQEDLVNAVNKKVEWGDSAEFGSFKAEVSDNGAVKLLFSLRFEDDATFTGGILVSGFDALVQYDDAWAGTGFLRRKYEYYNLDADATVTPVMQLSVDALPDKMQKIKIASIPIPFTSLPLGCGLFFNVYATIDITGEVSYSTSFSVDIHAEKGYLEDSPRITGGIEQRNEFNLEAMIEGKIGVQDVVALQILGQPIVDAGLEGGLGSRVKTEVRPKLTCLYLDFWLYCDVFAEVFGEWTDSLKIEHELMNEGNSPIKLSNHWERTDQGSAWVKDCTWDESEQMPGIEWSKYIGKTFGTIRHGDATYDIEITREADGLTCWLAKHRDTVLPSVSDFFIDLEDGVAQYSAEDQRSKNDYQITFSELENGLAVRVECLSGTDYFGEGEYEFKILTGGVDFGDHDFVISENDEISSLYGTNLYDAIDHFDDMSNSHATAGVEYANEQVIISSLKDDLAVDFIEVRAWGYCLYGIAPDMGLSAARKRALDAGGVLISSSSTHEAYRLPSSIVLFFYINDADQVESVGMADWNL